MIRARGLTFRYTADNIFNRASFFVGENQKAGLVGPNGSGKSTLFKLIVGQEIPSEGSLEITGSVAYVPQEIENDLVFKSTPSIRAYLNGAGSKEDFVLNRFLAGLELTQLKLDDPMADLSGGQKTKLALAKALIEEPENLLLDEPTNFMDLPGKKYVLNFLANYQKTLIVISHDLKLIDKQISKVLYIDSQAKKIVQYSGTYTQAMKLKKQGEELIRRQNDARFQHIKRMEKALPTLYRLTSIKGVRARVRQEERIKREKAKLAPKNQVSEFKFKFQDPSRTGELPLRVVSLKKEYNGRDIFHDLSFSIRRGEKFLLLGPNGSGKSTLIKIINGLLEPDDGRVEYGANLAIGYYSQEFETLDFNLPVLELVTREVKTNESRIRAFLSSFLFDQYRIKQKIGTLSGGEKTRLAIALLIFKNNNLLVLDEPTTYLDAVSQRIVLEALKLYRGTLFLVSHHPEFVAELKPDRALLLPSQKIIFWSDEYLPEVKKE